MDAYAETIASISAVEESRVRELQEPLRNEK